MALDTAVIETRLPAVDLDRARRWYRDRLGLEPVDERPGGVRYRCGDVVFCLFASSGASAVGSPDPAAARREKSGRGSVEQAR